MKEEKKKRPRDVKKTIAREITSIAVLCVSAFLLISLISHTVKDPSLNNASTKVTISNYGGLVGAYVSDAILFMFGFGGFVLFGFLVIIAIFFLFGNSINKKMHRVIGAFVFTVFSSLYLELLFGVVTLNGAKIHAGGIFGILFSNYLIRFIGLYGAHVLLLMGILISFLMVAQISIAGFFETLAKLAIRAAFAAYHFAVVKLERLKRLKYLKKDRKELYGKKDESVLDKIMGTISKKKPVIQEATIVTNAIKSKNDKKASQEKLEFAGREFKLPPLSLLNDREPQSGELNKEDLLMNSKILEKKLMDFGVLGHVVQIRPGPVITLYEFEPASGIKVNQIVRLQDDLAMALRAPSIRLIAPIPGKAAVGVEIPNKVRENVYLKEILSAPEFTKNKAKLLFGIGKDIAGEPVFTDLLKMPHLLIAGATGSGKSVFINSTITSLLFRTTPEDTRMILIDPKMLELSSYDDIPHLLLPVVYEPKKATIALRWAIQEMERRYKILSECQVKNITAYNKKLEKGDLDMAKMGANIEDLDDNDDSEMPDLTTVASLAKPVLTPAATPPATTPPAVEAEAKPATEPVKFFGEVIAKGPTEMGEIKNVSVINKEQPQLSQIELPPKEKEKEKEVEIAQPSKNKIYEKMAHIVIVIDELADLIMVSPKETEELITRLAQMARASGIHLIVATQRPSTDVITGLIKANFPTRISFQVASKTDSRVILDTAGAESLLGSGDMLFVPPGTTKIKRIHGAYISEEEITRVADFVRKQGKPDYRTEIYEAAEEEAEEKKNDIDDNMYSEALAIVKTSGKASISMLQRRLRIGYNRAARMIEKMEEDGLIGPTDGVRQRDVYVDRIDLNP